jgi:hypothetical protein
MDCDRICPSCPPVVSCTKFFVLYSNS